MNYVLVKEKLKRAFKIFPFIIVCLFLFIVFLYAGKYRVIRVIDGDLNVILLTVDTFRPDHIGCYGYKRDTTPLLDRIARKGVVFKNVISSSPWTSPGLISIFTGLYPSSHGVQARGQSLVPGMTTIFKVFKKHGFKTPNISYLTNIPNFTNLSLDSQETVYFKEASEPGDELFRWLDDHYRSPFFVWYHYRFLHYHTNTDKKGWSC